MLVIFLTHTFFYFSEFLLNHLHSNHKHRRFNGDTLDLTMVVPQVEVVQEFKRSPRRFIEPQFKSVFYYTNLARSAHPTPNFTNPEFQFPQFKG